MRLSKLVWQVGGMLIVYPTHFHGRRVSNGCPGGVDKTEYGLNILSDMDIRVDKWKDSGGHC